MNNRNLEYDMSLEGWEVGSSAPLNCAVLCQSGGDEFRAIRRGRGWFALPNPMPINRPSLWKRLPGVRYG